MNTAKVLDDDLFPDVRDALRATWQKAVQSVETSQRTLETAQLALGAATAKADEVRRQIEAACPPLGLDPEDVMGVAEDPSEQSRPRVDYDGPRAQYEEQVIDLLSDGRLVAGEQLRTTHHGQEHFARVESDGSISGSSIGSRSTLSAAARALVNGERNGWRFWSVLRNGRWIPVAELRNT